MADNEIGTLQPSPIEPNAAGLPLFQPAEYLDDLAHTDLTEAQKVEFLQTLWWIMGAFVNLGFGVDSVIPAFQKALEASPDTLEEDIQKDEFNIAAHEGVAERKD